MSRLEQEGRLRANGLVPVRVRRFGSDVLLTGPWGDWVFVTEEQLQQLMTGNLESGSVLHDKLEKAGLLRESLDVDAVVERQQACTRFQDAGPNLHIVVVTLRCNETCVYCHASRADMSETSTDMTPETADSVVEFVFRSTSPDLTIEFQGGEPLANFPVVKHIIERARERNQQERRNLEFSLVTNLSLMDEQKLDYLLDRRVQICTSIDGPAALHDKQRVLPGGSSYAEAVRWLRRIDERYREMGLDPSLYHVEALLTTTRASLGQAKQIVDSYVDLGVRAMFLRPLDPFGFASRTRETISYGVEEFLEFYREALDYIIELNRQGVQVLERYAAIFLTKILNKDEPNYLDIRSPCGAGVGQLAYDYDGRIFTCDEGRMLHEMGDSFFEIGRLGQSRYREVILSDTVRAMMLASNLDAQPDCAHCAYRPYCGTCPVYNYATQGSIWGRMRENGLCRLYKGILDYLFTRLKDADPELLEIFQRWVTVRPRTHFLQPFSNTAST